MSLSKTEICKAALSLCRASDDIDTIDDINSKGADLCTLFYQTTYDSALRLYAPRCCHTRATLVKDSINPDTSQWDARYLLPAAPNLYLKLLSMDYPGDEFSVERGYLLTDGTTVNSGTSIQILYASRVTEGELDSITTEVIYYKLAIRVSRSFTGSNTRAKSLKDELENIITDMNIASSGEQNLPLSHQQNNSWTLPRERFRPFSF